MMPSRAHLGIVSRAAQVAVFQLGTAEHQTSSSSGWGALLQPPADSIRGGPTAAQGASGMEFAARDGAEVAGKARARGAQPWLNEVQLAGESGGAGLGITPITPRPFRTGM